MAYQPIENYGMIGDMHAVALVAIDGSIDWLCIPHFDSPSVFARVLDEKKGGHFSIRPVDDGFTCKQFYWPDTNVLVTRYLAERGAAELTDFMPTSSSPGAGPKRRQVIRRLTAVRGSVRFRMECQPAFDYARADHETELEAGGARFSSSDLRLGLAASTPLVADGGGLPPNSPSTKARPRSSCCAKWVTRSLAILAFRRLKPRLLFARRSTTGKRG